VIATQAYEKKMTVTEYRKQLNGKFKLIFKWMKEKSAKRDQVLPSGGQTGSQADSLGMKNS
jgi:hypothetical protein